MLQIYFVRSSSVALETGCSVAAKLRVACARSHIGASDTYVCVCVFCMVQHRTEAMHLRVHVRPTWEFQSYPGIICLYIRRPVCRSMLQHSETCNHRYYMCTGECVLCIPKYKQEKSNMWPFATRRNSI